jgi:hypothetical protein
VAVEWLVNNFINMFKKLLLGLVLVVVPLNAQLFTKFSSYPRTTTLSDNDLLLAAFYSSGTYTTNKAITFTNFVSQLSGIIGGGGGSSVYVNGASVAAPNFATGTNIIVAVSAVTNIYFFPTNIVNAQIEASAAIARSKVANGTASHVVINDGSGVLSSEATLAKSRGGTAADNSSVTFPSSGTITITSDFDTADKLATLLGAGDYSGTGAFARVTSPTFVTPVLGAATGTSVNLSGSATVGGAILQGVDAISALEIDWSAGNTFSKTISGNSTFTFANATAGQWITVMVTASGSLTATWPTVTWKEASTPTQTASKTDFYMFFYDGTTYYGSATQNF